MVLIMNNLFKSNKVYHGNLGDLTGVQRLISRLVRLDRVPLTNPLEGLLLLRPAWRDHDVAVALADSCKSIWAVLWEVFDFHFLYNAEHPICK